jgi:hypothetical protein
VTAEDAPRPLAVLFGSQLGWSPARESQPLDSRCRTCGGSIAAGSRLYCAGCTRTGFEDRLRQKRARAPKPRAQAPPPKEPPRLTRREVRALRRTPEGREWLRSIGYEAQE